MDTIKYICLITILTLTSASVCLAANTEHELIRKQAHQAYNDGNWKDAYQLFQQLCLEVTNDPKLIGNDFVQAWYCLRNLNRLNELDRLDAMRTLQGPRNYHGEPMPGKWEMKKG